MAFLPLPGRPVAKPWGRSDLPAGFGTGDGRIGELWFDSPDRPLPLLVKWLFTSENLSVQVHPDDAQAQARGLPRGKEECWIVTAAEPGAILGVGTRVPLAAADLRAAALSGELEALIDWKPVQAGDWFHIAPGTIHAIGAGLTLVEIQQNADVTYRLYDYGRGRDLHLADGLAVGTATPYADARHGRLPAAGPPALLTRGTAFSIMHGGGDSLSRLPARDGWLVPLAGSITIAGTRHGAGAVLYGRDDGQAGVSADFRYLAVHANNPDGG